MDRVRSEVTIETEGTGSELGLGVGGLTFAGVKGAGSLPGISVEEGLAELTAAPRCLVLTCITHTSTHIARCEIQGHVKVTTVGMPMTLTFWSRTR